MDVRDALDRLDRIHDQLTRGEVYRGFRVPAVALVGALGLCAAALQPHCVPHGDSRAFVLFWSAVGAVGALVGFGVAVRSYFFREDEFERRRTRRVMGQFLPCVLAGALVTFALGSASEFVPLLPGLWAVAFGLGVIAVRPHLPPATGVVGLAYVLYGCALLAWKPDAPPGWCVGGAFGVGHLAMAVVLRNQSKGNADE